MRPLPFLLHDPQDASPQYLEDLATGYWFSEVLFAAVEMEVFTLLDPEGKNVDEIAEELGTASQGTERFLHALCALGLLTCDGPAFFNTGISQEYLVKGKPNYQGDSILWRKNLSSPWRDLRQCLEAGGRVDFGPPEENPEQLVQRIRKYITAMDRVAGTKVREILPLFEGLALKGELLDVGAGSGAIAAGFLECFPLMRATLLDLPEVAQYAEELMQDRGLGERVTCRPANILEPWPVERERFDLIILSNIVHAYAEAEISYILAAAAGCLKPGGYLLVHDFFLEHYPEKAALFDLNMFINTYNGKVFSQRWVREELERLRLSATGFISLRTDTGLVIASQDADSLAALRLDPIDRLVSRIQALGCHGVRPISVADIHVTDWTNLRCQFGCDRYGNPHCPPNSPAPQQTRDLLKDFHKALLIEGEPPTREFQHLVLNAEKKAFQAGYYKAFAFWAGPCSFCETCAADGVCRNTKCARPSMEAAGIDVFETARRAGFNLRTLSGEGDFVKYYALLLLE